MPAIEVASSATAHIDSALAGTDGLEKTGDGTLVLGGANTLTGALTVSAGTIEVSGSVGGSGASTVDLTVLDGYVRVVDGGSLNTRVSTVGTAAGTSSVMVSGLGSVWLNGADGLNLARNSGEAGSIIVEGGGKLVVRGTGLYSGAGAVLTVIGADSRVEIGDPVNLASQSWFSPSGGTFQVMNGASFYASGIYLGSDGGNRTEMTVSGSGSTVVGEERIYVGGQNGSRNVDPMNGNGAMIVNSGATVTAGTIGVAMDPNSQGVMTVSGVGSQVWAKANTALTTPTVGNFYVGFNGHGWVTVSNGASLKADNEIRIGYDSMGVGELAVGADSMSAAATAGRIDAASIVFGTGSGSLILNHTDTAYILAANVSGAGKITQMGSGTTIVTGDLTHTGGTVINKGILQIGNGGVSGSISGNIATSDGYGAGALVFDKSSDVVFMDIVSGSGTLEKKGTGTLALVGANTLTGTVTVSGGTLNLAGSVGGDVQVASGATLRGAGNANGAVDILDGGRLAVASGSTLTAGAMALGTLSTLEVTLGVPGSTAMVAVNGNLSLAGTLDLAAGTGFDSGVYRLIDYTGTSSGSGLAIGVAPAHSLYSVDTGTTGQVNLAVAAGLWWNGSVVTPGGGGVAGGSGDWTGSGTTNWTNENGTSARAWGDGGLAVFAGSAGTVQITAPTAPGVAGIEFLTSGYRITGTGVTLTPFGLSRPAILVDGVSSVATFEAQVYGTSGLEKTGAGRLVLTDARYTGDTWISAGTLQIGNGGFATGPVGNVVTSTGASYGYDHQGVLSYSGVISGGGSLRKSGDGTLILTGANTYAGGTTVSGGTLQIGNGGVVGAAGTGSIVNDGELVFVRSDTVTTTVTGSGRLVNAGTGTLNLTGVNSAGLGTSVEGGTLQLLAGATLNGDVSVATGAALRGETNGTPGGGIDGSVVIASGGSLLAAPAGTSGLYGLSMTGLTLSDEARVGVTLGANTGNAVFSTGSLTLDGYLDITNGGSMALGVYRLIDYTTLAADNELLFGQTPDTFAYQIQAVTGQVNVIVMHGDILYWNGATTAPDGTVHGGNGTWESGGQPANWLTAPINQSRTWNGGFAIFSGAPGTVTTSGSPTTTGMQFMVDGYTIVGSPVVLNAANGQTQVRVGDGTPAGASMQAEISSELTGTTGLEKTDLGVLYLTGDSSYSGGTTITQGVLAIGHGGTTGSILGDVSVATDATLAFARSDDITFSGAVSGGGKLVQDGGGILTLTGNSTFSGGTTISPGATLRIGNGGSTGAIAGDVTNDGTLAFDRSDATSFAGVISGNGTLRKQGGGTLSLTGHNGFAGATYVDGGDLAIYGGSSLSDTAVLQLASGTTLSLMSADETVGSLAGSGSVALNTYCLTTGGDGSSTSFGGTIGGSGCLRKTGVGTMALTGVNAHSGGTIVSGGAIEVSLDSAIGSGRLTLEGTGALHSTGSFTRSGAVTLASVAGIGGGTIDVTAMNVVTLSGSVSGDGQLTKSGAGLLVLSGTNSFTGATSVIGGQLTLNGGSTLADLARLTVGGGALVMLGDADETVGSLAGGGDVNVNGHCLTVGGDGTNAVFSGSISGVGCLVKSGSGTLSLSGTNTQNQGIAVSGGAVQVSTLAAMGTGGLRLTGSGALHASGTFTYGQAVSLTPMAGTGGGTFEVDADETLTLSGIVSGIGGLSKSGAGTLILSGINSYTGETRVQAGTLVAESGQAFADGGSVQILAGANLVLGADETIGAISGAGGVTLDDARLSIGTGADIGFDGAIGGTGGLTKLGIGSLSLTGTSSYSGDTMVTNGALAVSGRLSDSDVYVYDEAVLRGTGRIDRTVHVLEGGTLAGEAGSGLSIGRLDMASGAFMNVALPGLVGATVFDVTGDVTLNGTMNVTTQPLFGFGIYRVVNYGGHLQDGGIAVGALPAGLAGGVQTSISGQVNLLIEDPTNPTIFWNGDNTGPTQSILGGNGRWTADNRTNWINASGTIPRSWNGSFAIFQGAAGTATVDNSQGDVVTTGIQFVSSGMVVSGDPITLAGNGMTAIRVGDGTQDGSATVATIASVLTGAGGLQKTDFGTLILTGDNTYTGLTHVVAGRLQLGDGTSSGGVAGNIEVDLGGTLAFNRQDVYDFPGTITGEGNVEIIGGTVNFLRADGYSGPLSVVDAEFVLQPGAVSASQFTVGAGGRIGGTGTIGGLTVVDGGIAAPGYSPGTLTVTGNVNFAAGSTYRVDIRPDGSHDLIQASGTVTLDGGTVSVVAIDGTYKPGSSFTILSAQQGIVGKFAEVSANYAFLSPELTYGPTAVTLTVLRNQATFAQAAATPNQRAAAAAVEKLSSGNAVYDAILGLSVEGARAAFDSVSGELHASTVTSLILDSSFVRDAVTARMRQAMADGAPSEGIGPAGVGVGRSSFAWIQGVGADGHVSGNGNAGAVDRSSGNVFMGLDFAVGETGYGGVVAGYGRTSLHGPDYAGTAQVETKTLGLYGGTALGRVDLVAGFAQGWHSIDTARSIAFPGLSETDSAGYDATTTQLFSEASLPMDFELSTGRMLRVTPYASLAYVGISSDGLMEQGGVAALTGKKGDADMLFSTVGLRTSTTIELGRNVRVTPYLGLGWQHGFGDSTPVATLAFASGGQAFDVAGTPIARDAALIDVGMSYSFNDKLHLELSYKGKYSSDITENSVQGRLNLNF